MINASSVASPLNVIVDGNLFLSNIYRGVELHAVGAAHLTVQATATPGANLLSLVDTLAPATDTSLVLSGPAGGLLALILQDNNLPPPAARARVRFVNTSPDFASLDVYVNFSKQVSSLATNSGSSYIELTADTTIGTAFEFDFNTAGTVTPVLKLPNTTIVAGKTYTIYVVGPATAGRTKTIDRLRPFPHAEVRMKGGWRVPVPISDAYNWLAAAVPERPGGRYITQQCRVVSRLVDADSKSVSRRFVHSATKSPLFRAAISEALARRYIETASPMGATPPVPHHLLPSCRNWAGFPQSTPMQTCGTGYPPYRVHRSSSATPSDGVKRTGSPPRRFKLHDRGGHGSCASRAAGISLALPSATATRPCPNPPAPLRSSSSSGSPSATHLRRVLETWRTSFRGCIDLGRCLHRQPGRLRPGGRIVSVSAKAGRCCGNPEHSDPSRRARGSNTEPCGATAGSFTLSCRRCGRRSVAICRGPAAPSASTGTETSRAACVSQ